jgi:hypothetical protein
MLAALREETRGEEAPAHVEAALRDAFRARPKRPAGSRWWIGLAAGLAAAVVLGAGAAQWRISRPVAPPAARLQAPPVPALELPRPQPVMTRRARPAVRHVPKAAPEPRELATEFLPLDDTGILTPMESAQVLRVQVPRSTMMRFGLPVNQDRMMEPIHADVVFAQDGIARAIRFVK